MNILIIDRAVPQTIHSGKSLRLANLFKRLRTAHRLHYLAISPVGDQSQAPEWLRQLVHSCRVWTASGREFWLGRYANWAAGQPWFAAAWRYPEDFRRFSSSVRQLVQEEAIDVIHCFDDEAAQFIPDRLPCPWIADPADAMSLHAKRRAEHAPRLSERLRWTSISMRLSRYERQLLGRASATVYVSDVDARHHAPRGGRATVHVIPNGVDTAYFAPEAAFSPLPDSPRPRIILTGHMSFAPNHHAALRLLDRILPKVREAIPSVACDLVGADPSSELQARHDGDSVTVTGWVEDIRPWIARASVYACPMSLGAGIKNKLLESMAMAKAIVTTSRGCDGIAVRDGEQLLIADDESAFASKVIELLKNPARRRMLGASAQALAIERYSWDATTRAYDALYQRVVQEHRLHRNGHVHELARDKQGASP